jgi:thioredoxin-related protein
MLRSIALAFALAVAPFAVSAQENGGLHHEDWFAVTFKDVREDIEAAQSAGKRLALIVEQYGCVYCRKLHEEVLSDPEVRDYISANYMVVQINMFGDEEITDLDGTALPEKEMIRRWGVVFTPTVIFLPDEAPEGGTAMQAAVSTMPGAFGKWTTLDMFIWVRNKGYDGEEHFQKFHARHIEELRAAGRL